jgi:hypothetical protein
MKGWVFLLPTITKDDAEAYFPEHKVCQVPSGQGEGTPTRSLLASFKSLWLFFAVSITQVPVLLKQRDAPGCHSKVSRSSMSAASSDTQQHTAAPIHRDHLMQSH